MKNYLILFFACAANLAWTRHDIYPITNPVFQEISDTPTLQDLIDADEAWWASEQATNEAQTFREFEADLTEVDMELD